MTNLESIDTCTALIELVIADETIDDLILNVFISICNNMKRSEINSNFEYLNKKLRNSYSAHTP